VKISILSLFPGSFRGPLDESIIGRARERELVEIDLIDIRDFASGKHKVVDDRPYGGGPGMVMMAEPIVRAIESLEKGRVIYLSPQGRSLQSAHCRRLAHEEHLILLCGHYEGVDERVLEWVDEEISIGDYVLTNGCLPAMVLIDAAARFVPGVVGREESTREDSFEEGIFDYPHYTRPEVFQGKKVPDILLTGHHKKIEEWRREKAVRKTQEVRPELMKEKL